MSKRVTVAMLGIALAGCAGRDSQTIATVQPQDAYADCATLRGEIKGINAKATQLTNEQNVGADVVGKEAAALQARQQYLTALAADLCVRPSAPQVAARRASSPRRQSASAAPVPPPPQAAAPEPEPAPAPYQGEPH